MDSIWTLEEVATYLKVAERTVVSWVEKGIFPGGKVGTSWRFIRRDVEAWLNRQLASHRTEPYDGRALSIEEILTEDNLTFVDITSKKALFLHLAKQAMESKLVVSEELVLNELWNREALMSTGLGLGIAVPHVRLPELSTVEIYLLLNQSEITNYESIDDKPVRIIAFVMAGIHMQKEYLKVLSSVVGLLKNTNVRDAALACSDIKSAYRTITGSF